MTSADRDALVRTEWLAAHLSDPTCGSSIAPGITPAPISTAARNIAAAISRARCISTSITSPIRRTRCRTCCRPRQTSQRRSGCSGRRRRPRCRLRPHVRRRRRGAVWWMFRVFGCDNVAMLDGGFGKWTKEKLPTEMYPVRPEPRTFTATFSPALVRSSADESQSCEGPRAGHRRARARRSSMALRRMSSRSRSSAISRMP